MHRMPRWLYATALAIAPAIAACSDSTGPSGPVGQALTLDQLDSVFTSGPTRIEVKLAANSLAATEVHVEADDLEEKITSRVTAIDPAAGTITLTLGGLVVNYTDGTRFRTRSASNVSRASWEAAVMTALANGGQPPIEARRNAPATPQAPNDPSFTAVDLRLADAPEANKLEVYVDADNFAPSSNAPEIATLTVFGVTISITTTTELQDDDVPGNDDGPEGEFEGAVASVDSLTGLITLTDGRVVDAAGASFETDGDLFTLGQIAVAVAAGTPVKVEGNGTVATVGPPLVISATSIKAESDDGSGGSGSGSGGGNDNGANHT